MNPQTPDQDLDQQFTPQTPVVESTPEADAAALQAIDALESETDVVSQPEAPVAPQVFQPTQPVSAPISPEAPAAQPYSQAPAQNPVETVATAPVQAPSVVTPFPAQKASSKKTLLIVAAVVVVIAVGAIVGYFVFQSMGK